jgi:hypothetical protein
MKNRSETRFGFMEGLLFYINTECMDFLEKDLEQIICETPNNILRQKGLIIRGRKLRQVRIGNYGIADLVTYDRDDQDIHVNVYELKKEKIGISAYLQALGYAKGIRSYLKKRCPDRWVSISISLIGRDLDTSGNFPFITDFTTCSFYTYHYDFDGLTFKRHSGYTLTNEGF